MLTHDGVTLCLGGREFIAPALTFRQLKTLLPRLAAVTEGDTAAQLDVVLDLVEASLGRNYPDLTRDELENLLTLAEMPQAVAAVLTGSGFARGEPQMGE